MRKKKSSSFLNLIHKWRQKKNKVINLYKNTKKTSITINRERIHINQESILSTFEQWNSVLTGQLMHYKILKLPWITIYDNWYKTFINSKSWQLLWNQYNRMSLKGCKKKKTLTEFKRIMLTLHEWQWVSSDQWIIINTLESKVSQHLDSLRDLIMGDWLSMNLLYEQLTTSPHPRFSRFRVLSHCSCLWEIGCPVSKCAFSHSFCTVSASQSTLSSAPLEKHAFPPSTMRLCV